MTERLSTPDSGGFRHRPEYDLEDREMRQLYLADAARLLEDFMHKPRPDLQTDRDVQPLEDGAVAVMLGMSFTFQDDYYAVFNPDIDPDLPEGRMKRILPRNPTVVSMDMRRVHGPEGEVQRISATFRQHDTEDPDWGYKTTYMLFPDLNGEARGMITTDAPHVFDGKEGSATIASMTLYDCMSLYRHIEFMNHLERLSTEGTRTSPDVL